jgi:hypothetical protein
MVIGFKATPTHEKSVRGASLDCVRNPKVMSSWTGTSIKMMFLDPLHAFTLPCFWVGPGGMVTGTSERFASHLTRHTSPTYKAGR